MSEVLTTIISAVGSAALTATMKGPAETLSQWWYIHFGHETDAKYNLLKEKSLNDYKEKISKEVLAIPEENIQEPKLNILGPALEASKYYIDDNELRVLFSKLVASSMDSSKNDITQPAFVEIVKQMIPLDAQNLASLYHAPAHQAPIVNISLENTQTRNYNLLFEHLYLSNKNTNNYSKTASSLVNLVRLGLIEIDYMSWVSNENIYNKFEENYIFKYFKQEYQDLEDENVTLNKGLVKLTPFGRDFCQICL